MPDYYDCIVVGAGPAGAAAARTLGEAGLSALLLERGEFPGAKNMFGGAIYREPTQMIVSNFMEQAPVERTVVADELWMMENDSAVKVGFTGLRFAEPPYNKFTVLRPRFDYWLAQKATEVGVSLRNNALVRKLLYEKRSLGRQGPVAGVVLDDGEEIRASCVILGEGVNAFLTKQAGLRGPIPAHALTLYVKEVLSLPAHKIEERFNLQPTHGAVIGMLGWPTAGIVGKAGIWTNKDSISLIIGGYLNQIVDARLSPYHLLQRLKEHPLVKKLIQGAKVEEYMAHLIPKGGYSYQPKMFADGILVAGDAAVMVSGRRGTDLAMLSGKLAAETVVQAKARGDFSETMLSNYKHKLDDTFFMKDIQAKHSTLRYFKNFRDSDFVIASMFNKLGYEFFTEDLSTGPQKMTKLRQVVLHQQHYLKTLTDVYQGIKFWGPF